MKYLREFETLNNLNAIYGTNDYVNPNVFTVNNSTL